MIATATPFAELAGVEVLHSVDGLSVVPELKGQSRDERPGYLYWDYGHCRRRYDQAVRWKDWKGIRLGRDGSIQLYDLSMDVSEEHDVAEKNSDVIRKMSEIMKTAPEPNDRYPIGTIYRDEPIWKRDAGKPQDRKS